MRDLSVVLIKCDHFIGRIGLYLGVILIREALIKNDAR